MLHIFSVVVFHRSLVNWNCGALVYVPSAIHETSNGIVVFHTSMVSWRGYICPKYMCILIYVKLIWCSGIPQIYFQLEKGGPWYMCILLYVKLLCCSGFPYMHGQLDGQDICLKCMYILLYVKHIWCSDIPYIYGQWDWWYICPKYMCILLYVTSIQCSSIWYIYGQLGCPSNLGLCAFCYMQNLFGVVVFHRSMVNWRRRLWHMCILLYVKLIWCSGIPKIYGSL